MATAAIRPITLTAPYYLNLFAKETKYEFLKAARNRMYSLATLGFPIMFYLLFGVTNRHIGPGLNYAQYLVAGYSCFGMIAAALFNLGAGVATERAQGWLELKQASPMPRLAYLGAKVLTSMLFGVAIVTALVTLGIALGGVHVTVLQVVHLTTVVVVGSIPFASLGLLLSLLMPANAAPGVINLIYLPMSFCSGLWMPIEVLPHWLQKIAPALPTYHYAQLALNVFGYARSGATLIHWEALAGFACLMLGTAWLVFTRSEAKA
ncbi:ABC transporter permease [Alloacidobacterium dinghuense]|uniref:Transport permease protein n=1 Tax=Alloacidobacterium dinghuense TaxID=2763107 RepID=A0A7G8BLU4_9BACT|nr:ABC transporter permease [Alloacidobacterium dinghuense]QNI33514.1 ABC transporter permease [Alloacidobacterium dinghuense]